MLELSLIQGSYRPKAKPDSIFLLKESILQTCYTIEKTFHTLGEPYMEILQKHPSMVFIRGRIRQNYYDLVDTVFFEKRFEEIITNYALDKREDFYLLRIDKEVLNILNARSSKPTFLSPPFYYDGDRIDSLYRGKFYGKFIHDSFGHPTLVLRKEGQEYMFASYKKPELQEFYPTFTRPFLAVYSVNKVDEMFGEFNRKFFDSYMSMKGLFRIWYGFNF